MEPIIEGNFYHIYNRGAGRNFLFKDDEDFSTFINKYTYYVTPAVKTYAWCLLNNHFHVLIGIRTQKEQVHFYQTHVCDFRNDKFHGKMSPEQKPFSGSRQLNHFMNSFTRSINSKYGRSGTLIEGPLKRKKVVDRANLLHLVCYIHRNPIHHGIIEDYHQYKFCSYLDYLSRRDSFIEKSFVLDAFGGEKKFITAHQEFRLKWSPGKDGPYFE